MKVLKISAKKLGKYSNLYEKIYEKYIAFPKDFDYNASTVNWFELQPLVLTMEGSHTILMFIPTFLQTFFDISCFFAEK